MKLKQITTIYLWLFVGIGAVALIAYLRILFFYNKGHINFAGAPPILLVLSLPLLASGIFGLAKKKSFNKQPFLLRSAAVIGFITFVTVVLFLIAAMYALGQALQGSGAFQ